MIMEWLQSIDIEVLILQAFGLIKLYGPKILGAIVTLWIGLKGSRIVGNMVITVLRKNKVDISLRRFLASLVEGILKVLVFVAAIGMLGVQTTSFIAVLGAAGLAVGLALQGSLSNFAGGVLIILFKPFKVGDYIAAQGHEGSVHSIQIFCTVINTTDNKRIIIPNGDLSNGSVVNFTAEKTRRIDMTFGIGYNDDIQKAKDIMMKLMKTHKLILKDPAPFIGLAELADSSINFTVRSWGKTSDYWTIYFDLNEQVKAAFDKEGISIPYPQQDVHMYQMK